MIGQIKYHYLISEVINNFIDPKLIKSPQSIYQIDKTNLYSAASHSHNDDAISNLKDRAECHVGFLFVTASTLQLPQADNNSICISRKSNLQLPPKVEPAL